jgi:DNA-binding transcriptional regulator YiaG
MANIGALLKAEITRLCRREIRKEMMVVRKATVSSRHHIAALRKQVSALEQKAGQLAKRAGTPMASTPTGLPERPVRFVAKGLKSLRKRLGLSAAQLATLLSVSEQSVYNWETKKATPRKEQFAALIGLRGVGKREVQQRLAAKAPAQKAGKKRAARKSRK